MKNLRVIALKIEGGEEGSFRAWQLRQFVHFCKCFSMVGRIQLRVSGSPTVSSELRHRVACEITPNSVRLGALKITS